MISIEALEALRDTGGTLDQAIAMLRADRERLIRRRCERAVKAALFPAPGMAAMAGAKMNNAATPATDTAAGSPAGDSQARTVARARERLERAAILSAAVVRVGLAILSHYNRQTGRCYPSLATLGRSANCSERTARRAVKRLRALQLFDVDLHAGRQHSNNYRPRWAALLALRPVTAPEMNNAATAGRFAPASGQIDAANPASGVPQTSEENLIQSGEGGTRAAAPRKPQQTSMLLPIDGGLAARRHKALVRVELAIRGKYRDAAERRLVLLNGLAGLPPDWSTAVADAELAAAGSGLTVFERSLRERGPPLQSAG